MKKLFTTLAFFAGLSISAFAQNCYTAPTTITPGTGMTPGLHPSSDSLPCAVVGTTIADTIYFTNFTSFSGFTVSSLTIDSIGNLPKGTCWVSNKANNTFAGGENGVIFVSGHIPNNTPAGQYKLGIYIHATAGAITLPPYTNAETVANLRYYTRVTCSGSACPSVDTENGKTQSYIAYTPSVCNVGINEVNSDLSNVSVVPNPFASNAKVLFNSEVEGTFTVKMFSLLGATVSSKEVSVSHGSNEFTIERNNLSAGIYIMSISNGTSSSTKKVIID